MKCIHCSSDIKENTRICPVCGAEQPDGNIPKAVNNLRIALSIEAALWIIIGLLQIGFFITVGIPLIKTNPEHFRVTTTILLDSILCFVLGAVIIKNVFHLKRNHNGIVQKYSFSKGFIKLYIGFGILLLISIFSMFYGLFSIFTLLFIILFPTAILLDALIRTFVGINAKSYQVLGTADIKPEEEPVKEIKEELQEAPSFEVKKPVNPEIPSPSGNKIICPVCGKEQTKNAFGCIYCHTKWENN